ncbi:MAG: amino acid ABC transporter permease [Promethearchaeota archaeon]
MTINNNETETEKKDISKFKVIIKRTFGNIRLTRKNFGWWFLSLFLLILLIGAIRTLIVPDSNYFDVLLIILDWFLLLFGLSLETIDYRAPIIFRGLATAAVLSFNISLVSVAIGFILAALLAVILVNKGKVYGLKFLAQAYVDFFRSTPLLVQILMVYFGVSGVSLAISEAYGVRTLTAIITDMGFSYEVTLGTLALILNTAAYQAEIIRAGILSIPTGQTEAARALGLSQGQTMSYVILPQTFRMVVPPLTNEIINVLLNSSLLSVIGVFELTKRSRSLQSYYFLWEVFFIAALFYFVIAFSLSKLTKRIEIKLRIPGLGVSYD